MQERYLIPAIFSFLLPGLGQIAKGEVRKGIWMMVGVLISSLAVVIYVGYVITPVLYIWSICDAYLEPVPNYTEEKKKELTKRLIQILIVSGILLIITILLLIFAITNR